MPYTPEELDAAADYMEHLHNLGDLGRIVVDDPILEIQRLRQAARDARLRIAVERVNAELVSAAVAAHGTGCDGILHSFAKRLNALLAETENV